MLQYEIILREFYQENKFEINSILGSMVVHYSSDPIILTILFHTLFDQQHSKDKLKKNIMKFFLAWMIGKGSYVVASSLLSKIDTLFMKFLTKKIVERKTSDIETSVYVEKMTKLQFVFRQYFLQFYQAILPRFLTLFIQLCYIFYLNRKVGTVLFISALVHMFVLYRSSSACSLLPSIEESMDSSYKEQLQRILTSVDLISSVPQGIENEINDMEHSLWKQTKYNKKTKQCYQTHQQTNIISSAICFVIPFVYALRLYNQNESGIDFDTLTTLLATMKYFIDRMYAICDLFPTFFLYQNYLSESDDLLRENDNNNKKEKKWIINDTTLFPNQTIYENIMYGHEDTPDIRSNIENMYQLIPMLMNVSLDSRPSDCTLTNDQVQSILLVRSLFHSSYKEIIVHHPSEDVQDVIQILTPYLLKQGKRIVVD